MFKTRHIAAASAVLFLLPVLNTSCRKPAYPEGLYAELYTGKGIIILALEFENTPMTTANFVGLAEGKIKNQAFPEGTPFFNGTRFHRVIPGHVIQAGAPNVEGKDGTGYEIPNEIFPGLGHDQAGMLGMANGGPHTNSSQFYITLGDRSYLDGDYTVFGRVHEGLDVVNSIEQGDEILEIKIIRVGRSAKKFKVDDEGFRELVAQVKKQVADAEQKKKAEEEAYIQNEWPDAVKTESGLKYVILSNGTGKKPESGDTLKIVYSGRKLGGESFWSTDDAGKPGNIEPARPFAFEVGVSNVNQGFDEAVSDMLYGEKRLVIVPSSLAYGRSGYYAPNIPGRKRFVISPNTTLIYEIERLE